MKGFSQEMAAMMITMPIYFDFTTGMLRLYSYSMTVFCLLHFTFFFVLYVHKPDLGLVSSTTLLIMGGRSYSYIVLHILLQDFCNTLKTAKL